MLSRRLLATVALLLAASCGPRAAPRAPGAAGDSDPGDPDPLAAPGQVTGLTAVAGDGRVSLAWAPVEGAVAYWVYWSDSGHVRQDDAFLRADGPALEHDGLVDGTCYRYAVAAFNDAGEGPLSAEVSAVPAAPAAEPPPSEPPVEPPPPEPPPPEPPPVATYPLGGTVSGLRGTGLVLASGADTVTVSADGAFTFPEPLAAGAGYAVTVATAPTSPSQRCLVLDGAGLMPAAAVADVEVVCSLQIAAFNLENFDSTASVAKRQAIAAITLQNGFDAMAVEEIADQTTLASFVQDYLGTGWSWVLGASGASSAQHVGLVYRGSVLAVTAATELGWAGSGGIIDETATQWSGLRLPLRVDLSMPGGALTFSLVVVHLKAMGDSTSCGKRRSQVDDLDAYVRAHASERLLVLGDFNDEIAGTGVCASIDTLAPLEAETTFTFLTAQPASMSSVFYTDIPYRSTIDQLYASASFFSLCGAVDSEGHRARVVMHGDTSISDHQPPTLDLELP